MATYTISINERTNAGKSLLAYLRSLSVIVNDVPEEQKFNKTTLKALEEVKKGKVTRCSTFEDYLHAVKDL